MKVETGSKWTTAMGERIFNLTLEDTDGIRKYGPEVWEGFTVVERFRALQSLAEAMVVAHLAREGVLSPEYAAERIGQIRADEPAVPEPGA